MKVAPPFFYKYRDLLPESRAWVDRTILHDEIYFARRSSFNDPFDCNPTFVLSTDVEKNTQTFINVLERRAPHLSQLERISMARKLAEKPVLDPSSESTRLLMQQNHLAFIEQNAGIYCVSEACDSVLMWSHYAHSHTGVCLKFDSEAAPFIEAQYVDYVPTRSPICRETEDDEQSMVKALLTKHEGWLYEREWRAIDYASGPGVRKVSPRALQGIVLGAQISAPDEAHIRKMVQLSQKSLTLERAVASDTDFLLHIVKA